MGAAEQDRVDARIVYWGIPGAGVTTNLRAIHARLRPDHRGDLRRVPTRLDPSSSYPLLPIELGQVGGVRTRLQIIGMPGGPSAVAARKQLLDRVDGLVLVIDCEPGRLDENLSSFDELRRSLSAYGRSLQDLPVVVQYNKRDLARSFDIESLHRKLDLRHAAVFETVAREGTGVLQTLTTISKRVVRVLSERHARPVSPPHPTPATPPLPSTRPARTRQRLEGVAANEPPSSAGRMSLEDAILLEGAESNAGTEAIANATLRDAQHALDRPWSELEEEAGGSDGFRLDADLRIVEVGPASIEGVRSLRIPLTLGNPSGARAQLALTIALDPLLDPDS